MILLRQVRKLANFEIDLSMPRAGCSPSWSNGSTATGKKSEGGAFEAGKVARNCWVVTDYIVNTTSNLDLLKKL